MTATRRGRDRRRASMTNITSTPWESEVQGSQWTHHSHVAHRRGVEALPRTTPAIYYLRLAGIPRRRILSRKVGTRNAAVHNCPCVEEVYLHWNKQRPVMSRPQSITYSAPAMRPLNGKYRCDSGSNLPNPADQRPGRSSGSGVPICRNWTAWDTTLARSLYHSTIARLRRKKAAATEIGINRTRSLPILASASNSGVRGWCANAVPRSGWRIPTQLANYGPVSRLGAPH